MCHNPSDTDFSQRPAGQTAQSINMALMVHKIHDGVNIVKNGGKPYSVAGFGGSSHNFSGILYPAFSPSGSVNDLANCAMCHVNSSEQNDLNLSGLNPVVDPQGLINPVQPFTSACTACHVGIPPASHALSNTTSLGEACAVCHSSGAAYAVDQVHAGF
jgi:OmcA/MtrC family decaheme c-type cytochrome